MKNKLIVRWRRRRDRSRSSEDSVYVSLGVQAKARMRAKWDRLLDLDINMQLKPPAPTNDNANVGTNVGVGLGLSSAWKHRLRLRWAAAVRKQQRRRRNRNRKNNNNNNNNNNKIKHTGTHVDLVPLLVSEPVQPAWFDPDGYPLTSRRKDDADRFVNPWNSESTNGEHPIRDVFKWRLQRLWENSYTSRLEPQSQSLSFSKTTDTTRLQRQKEQALQPPSDPKAIKLTWIGHSTTLVQMGNFTILTDPHFSHRASPLQKAPFGVGRYTDPALTVQDLVHWNNRNPKTAHTHATTTTTTTNVDVVLISHDHYDHLDYWSVLDLHASGTVSFWIVPLGIKAWLVDECGIAPTQVVELEWWEGVQLTKKRITKNHAKMDPVVQLGGLVRKYPTSQTTAQNDTDTDTDADTDTDNNNLPDVTLTAGQRRDGLHHGSTSILDEETDEMIVTCAPAQHWCSRTPFDRNQRLWCSFAVETTTSSHDKSKFYFGGDTGLPPTFPLHRQIGDRLGPFDLAALPIGAYAPSFFMRDSHVNPREALEIHDAIGSKRSVAIHWGTFALADEGYDEPPRLLELAIQETNHIKNNKNKNDRTCSVDFCTIPQGHSIESTGDGTLLTTTTTTETQIT